MDGGKDGTLSAPPPIIHRSATEKVEVLRMRRMGGRVERLKMTLSLRVGSIW